MLYSTLNTSRRSSVSSVASNGSDSLPVILEDEVEAQAEIEQITTSFQKMSATEGGRAAGRGERPNPLHPANGGHNPELANGGQNPLDENMYRAHGSKLMWQCHVCGNDAGTVAAITTCPNLNMRGVLCGHTRCGSCTKFKG
jgi:hypothetical protein